MRNRPSNKGDLLQILERWVKSLLDTQVIGNDAVLGVSVLSAGQPMCSQSVGAKAGDNRFSRQSGKLPECADSEPAEHGSHILAAKSSDIESRPEHFVIFYDEDGIAFCC